MKIVSIKGITPKQGKVYVQPEKVEFVSVHTAVKQPHFTNHKRALSGVSSKPECSLQEERDSSGEKLNLKKDD